ncbi:phosphotransferase family protein [Natrinema salsiterrestre]|uniref:Phosphotransferase n=1 Tax=Natrinema salsiterrestre TaxID=2950540 RepID=A0A9Q4L236_9EURY|nr:phosphotransferase [Natrinema salsiterrestre]MDF9745954.1 phosphotransferase [Natrinema salsiterrestre]
MTGEPWTDAFDDELRAGAAAALECIDDRPRTVEPIRRGNRKRTVVIRFREHPPIVVQVCDEPARLRTEATLLTEIAERTDVPVPPVLAFGRHDDVASLLTEYVPGDDLHERFRELTPETRRSVVESFGSSLARLHEAFRFAACGALVPAGDTLTPEGAAWDAWFGDYAKRAVGRLPRSFDPIRTELRELVADRPRKSAPPTRLYPWDLRPGNALVADGNVTALVDWEAPLAAPAPLSVAKAEYLAADWYVSDPAPLRDAFRAGYAGIRPYPTVSDAERAAAIADSAVDSSGDVTNPRYPELAVDESIAFHRRALEECL